MIIELTDAQAAFLSNVLWDTTDCGPDGEGWASSELTELRILVDDAIEAGTTTEG